jgi:hypothetical protein
MQIACKCAYSLREAFLTISEYSSGLLYGCCTQILLGRTRTCDPRISSPRLNDFREQPETRKTLT